MFAMPLRSRPALVLVLLVASFAVYALFSGGEPSRDANAPIRVTLAPAVRKDIPFRVELVGTVVAYESVAIKSRVDSQVTEVHFKDGDIVAEGQVLFTLDDRAIKAQIAQLSAALNKEKAELANAELQYTRAQNLRKTQVVAQAQVDEAKAAFEAQQALVGVAQANLENAQVSLTYTQVMAPIGGRTGTIGVTRGNNVKANDTQAMVTINRISPIRVQTAIPQRYYEQVRAALNVGEVTVVARNKEAADSVSGTLEYLENTIDVSSGTFAARALFPNADEKLWPGMFVNVSIDLGEEKNALTIPAVAVQGDEGKRFVFAVSDDGKKAMRKPIEVGISTSETVVVHSGLTDGDRVLIDGILRVTDGSNVTYDETPASPPSS